MRSIEKKKNILSRHWQLPNWQNIFIFSGCGQKCQLTITVKYIYGKSIVLVISCQLSVSVSVAANIDEFIVVKQSGLKVKKKSKSFFSTWWLKKVPSLLHKKESSIFWLFFPFLTIITSIFLIFEFFLFFCCWQPFSDFFILEHLSSKCVAIRRQMSIITQNAGF